MLQTLHPNKIEKFCARNRHVQYFQRVNRSSKLQKFHSLKTYAGLCRNPLYLLHILLIYNNFCLICFTSTITYGTCRKCGEVPTFQVPAELHPHQPAQLLGIDSHQTDMIKMILVSQAHFPQRSSVLAQSHPLSYIAHMYYYCCAFIMLFRQIERPQQIFQKLIKYLHDQLISELMVMLDDIATLFLQKRYVRVH